MCLCLPKTVKRGKVMDSVRTWQNDPHHNIESKANVRAIPLTLEEWNKAGKSDEADKYVERFFLVPHGLIWLLYHITDIPEKSDSVAFRLTMRSGTTVPSKDGMVTMMTVRPHMTKDGAESYIRDAMEDFNHIDPETLRYVYEF
jgi:hypothetical protein